MNVEIKKLDGVRVMILHKSLVKKSSLPNHCFSEFYFGYCLDYGLFCIADNAPDYADHYTGRIFDLTLDFEHAWEDYLSYFSNCDSESFWESNPDKNLGKVIKRELLDWRVETIREGVLPLDVIDGSFAYADVSDWLSSNEGED